MKKYKIKVNGSTYEVEVEEMGEQESIEESSKQPNEPKAAPTEEAKPSTNNEEAETVEAPMTGAISSIDVASGDTVSAGDTLLVLEAMKMENEIVAPRDGTVASIETTQGANVNAGDPLVTLE